MTTATTEEPVAIPATPAASSPYRMSYEVYERIAELGLIRPEEHVILLDGILVQTMTKGADHSSSLYDCFFSLVRSTPDGWHVRQEQPITLRGGPRGDSAPEPDVAVVVGHNGNYRRRQPGASEVSLVVKVATSAAAFRVEREGLERYAFAGIPAAIIVALHDNSAHIFTEPSGSATEPARYARVQVKRPGESLELELRGPSDRPSAVLGPIAVASLFPPAE